MTINKRNIYHKPKIQSKEMHYKLFYVSGFLGPNGGELLAADCPPACGPGWCSIGTTAYCFGGNCAC